MLKVYVSPDRTEHLLGARGISFVQMSLPTSTSKKRKRDTKWLEEFILAGSSTAVACFFSNPFDCVKTRMQLQGELKGKGTYTKHYRNVFHAAYTIGRVEGITALQKGLGPAIIYQFVMNGVRLGSYQSLVNMGFTNPKGASDKKSSDFVRTVIAGAMGGCLGGVVASPLYLVKTQLQSMATKEIAVGHQYSHRSTLHALRQIYRENGLKGLWRGVEGAVPRLTLGSALQLSTFSSIKQYVQLNYPQLPAYWVPVLASLLSAVNIVIFMEPFDVVRTRLYNQPVNAAGRGVYYQGITDCFQKVYLAEGFFGFYKGAGPAFLRMAPQAVLGLSFWDFFRRLYFHKSKGDEEDY